MNSTALSKDIRNRWCFRAHFFPLESEASEKTAIRIDYSNHNLNKLMSFLLKSLPSPRSYILATQTALVAATLTGRSMSTSTITNTTWPVRAYEPRHQSWPYTDADFARHDSSADTRFYNEARLVTHIDDAAIVTLGQYYDSVLPRKGRLLDFCS